MEGLKITGVELTSEAQRRVLETAVEAGHTNGIGYWAGDVELVEVEGTHRVALKLRDEGGGGLTDAAPRSVFKLRQVDAVVTIYHHNISLAVQRMATDPARCQCAGFVAQLLTGDLDGPLADAIVQVACFGKVIYG